MNLDAREPVREVGEDAIDFALDEALEVRIDRYRVVTVDLDSQLVLRSKQPAIDDRLPNVRADYRCTARFGWWSG